MNGRDRFRATGRLTQAHAGVLQNSLNKASKDGTAAPARAHGGPIRLKVTGDGADRVLTTVTWKKDGHPVTDPVDLTLVAGTVWRRVRRQRAD